MSKKNNSQTKKRNENDGWVGDPQRTPARGKAVKDRPYSNTDEKDTSYPVSSGDLGNGNKEQ